MSSPEVIDQQFHAGSPPALMLVADAGRTILVRNPWTWDTITPITATDDTGSPLTIASLDSTWFLTIAITDDGRLVQVDPWHYRTRSLPHPGVVTDVSVETPLESGPQTRPFWAAGSDEVDGQLRPVVWRETGLKTDLQGTVSGTLVTAVAAVGEPGGIGVPLVARATAGAFALLPEPGGSSRLWFVPEDPDAATLSTELVFHDPTAMTMGGDGQLWIADRDGLHAVDPFASPMAAQTVSDLPVRSFIDSGWPPRGYAVMVLDTEGTVKAVAGTGDTREYAHDEAATDAAAFFNGSNETPQLYIVHGNDDEVIVVNPWPQ